MKSDICVSKSFILETGAKFRLGREAEANEKLLSVVNEIARHLHNIPENILTNLTILMQKALDAQARQDHIGVADVLEFEILPQLHPVGMVSNTNYGKRRR